MELDEMIREAHAAEDKFQKAMLDAAKLADELRGEQDTCLYSLKDCKLRECQLKDMQTRLDETEVNAMKGGKKAMNKMFKQLKSEIDPNETYTGQEVVKLVASCVKNSIE